MKGGKIGYAKTSTCIVDFARGNWLYRNISGGGGGDSTISLCFRWEILLWKNHSHFSRGKYQGGGSYSLTEPIHIPKGSIKGYLTYKKY